MGMDEVDALVAQIDSMTLADLKVENERLTKENDRLKVDNGRLKDALMHLLGFRYYSRTPEKAHGTERG